MSAACAMPSTHHLPWMSTRHHGRPSDSKNALHAQAWQIVNAGAVDWQQLLVGDVLSTAVSSQCQLCRSSNTPHQTAPFPTPYTVPCCTRSTWMPRDNIDVLARAARRAAANTLAALCIVRAPDYTGGDEVERAVLAMAVPDIDGGAAGDTSSGADQSSAGGAGVGVAFDISSASEWPGDLKKEDVLVAPAEARSAWREFMSASTLAVQQVRETWHVYLFHRALMLVSTLRRADFGLSCRVWMALVCKMVTICVKDE